MIKSCSKFKKIIGKRIRDKRNEKGFSIEELAEKADVNPRYLGEVERGEKSPTTNYLEKVFEALDITFEQFFMNMQPSSEQKGNVIFSQLVDKMNKISIDNQKIVLEMIDTMLRWKEK
jgi:XRE family transcriptional regulator, regulator of sulfur utilization